LAKYDLKCFPDREGEGEYQGGAAQRQNALDSAREGAII
jgi:hypothetical protein